MNTNLLTIAAQLSDDALDAKLKFLAQGSRQMTVELIAHLAEFATRKLHRAKGTGRLFGYCTQILRFSGLRPTTASRPRKRSGSFR